MADRQLPGSRFPRWLRIATSIVVGIVTYLNPIIGHHNGDRVGKECARTGKSVKEVVVEMGLLSAEDVDRYLSLESFMNPTFTGRTYEPGETGLPQA